MKQCTKCESELNNEAKFCPKCGEKQIEKEQNKFCENCGEKLTPSVKFCPSCGKPIGQSNSSYQDYSHSSQGQSVSSIVRTISGRGKMVAIFWIVVASLQALVCIINIASISYGAGVEAIIDTLVIAALSAINFVGGFKSLKFSNEVLIKPVGIIKRYEKSGSYIGLIVYHGILFIINAALVMIWGILVMAAGLAASIFALAGIRNYAVQNVAELERIERSA